MERFAPALRRVADELDMPRVARTALLLEMAADLEAIYEYHRARGVDEEEAARRAEQAVLASGEVIRRLGRLHRSAWRGWAEEVAERLPGGVDLLLAGALAFPALLLAMAIGGRVLVGGGSPLVWVLMATGPALATLIVTGLLGAGGGRPAARNVGLATVVIGGVAVAVGLLAGVLGFQAAAGGLSEGASRAELTPIAAGIARDAAAVLIGLLQGLAGLLGWFVLVGRDARRASREVAALLGDPSSALDSTSPDTIPLVRRRHG